MRALPELVHACTWSVRAAHPAAFTSGAWPAYGTCPRVSKAVPPGARRTRPEPPPESSRQRGVRCRGPGAVRGELRRAPSGPTPGGSVGPRSVLAYAVVVRRRWARTVSAIPPPRSSPPAARIPPVPAPVLGSVSSPATPGFVFRWISPASRTAVSPALMLCQSAMPTVGFLPKYALNGSGGVLSLRSTKRKSESPRSAPTPGLVKVHPLPGVATATVKPLTPGTLGSILRMTYVPSAPVATGPYTLVVLSPGPNVSTILAPATPFSPLSCRPLWFASFQTRPVNVPVSGAGVPPGTTTFVRLVLLAGFESGSVVVTVPRAKLPSGSGWLSASDTGAGSAVALPVQRQS